MTEIRIPDPSLVVLIGAAGAGKSTFAQRHFESSAVLSSDAYRALISGDPADQAVSRAAFARLHRTLGRRLDDRRLGVVDATNLGRSARLALLRLAAKAGVPAVAIVFDLPAAVVLTRNAARAERVVGEAVVRQHLAQVRAMMDGETDFAVEGFLRVTVLRDPHEVDAVTIVRVAG